MTIQPADTWAATSLRGTVTEKVGPLAAFQLVGWSHVPPALLSRLSVRVYVKEAPGATLLAMRTLCGDTLAGWNTSASAADWYLTDSLLGMLSPVGRSVTA